MEAGVEVTGEEPFNYFMSILYPSDSLLILEYNRVLRSLNDMTSSEFYEKMLKYYEIEEIPQDGPKKPQQKFQCSMLLDGKWHRCTVKPDFID